MKPLTSHMPKIWAVWVTVVILMFSNVANARSEDHLPVEETPAVGSTASLLSAISGLDAAYCQYSPASGPLTISSTYLSTTYPGYTLQSINYSTGGSNVPLEKVNGNYVFDPSKLPAEFYSINEAAEGSTGIYINATLASTSGPAITVEQTYVKVNLAPGPVVIQPPVYCVGNAIEPLTAVGNNLTWYMDFGRITKLGEGPFFSPPVVADGAKLVDFYVTETTNGCESLPAPVSIMIIASSDPPVVTALTDYCVGDAINNLTAIGVNLIWFSDASLTHNLGFGSSLATGVTSNSSSTTSFYVTQNSNGCESSPATATIAVHALPASPAVTPASYCVGDAISSLTATGSNLKWYADAALTNLRGTGASFASGVISDADKVASFFVTQTVDGCASTASTTTITIKPAPALPVVEQVAYCVGQAINNLSAVGTDVKWYADAALTDLKGTGTSFATGLTGDADMAVDFYATQTVNGCASQAAQARVIINPLPEAAFDAVDFVFGEATTFTDASTLTYHNGQTGDITTWAWSFDDGDLLNSGSGTVPTGTHDGKTTGTFDAPAHQYQAIGNYSVTLTVMSSDGCSQSATRQISILEEVIAGIVDPAYAKGFSVFPNPARAGLTVQIPEASAQAVAIHVFDAFGKHVHNTAIQPGERAAKVDTAGLGDGMYLVVIETPVGKVCKKAMVVQGAAQ